MNHGKYSFILEKGYRIFMIKMILVLFERDVSRKDHANLSKSKPMTMRSEITLPKAMFPFETTD